MNCDEFLEALTSADVRRQAAARSHIQSCRTCGALADVDALLKQELIAREPLPQRLRAAWEGAMDSPSTRRASEGRFAPRPLSPQLLSLAAALLLLLCVMPLIWQFAKVKDTVNLPGIETSPNPAVAVKTINASADLADLLDQVNALEAELNKTSQQAELVDIRREVDALLATFSHW